MLEANPQAPQHHDSGTLSQFNPPNTPLQEVLIMANYQPRQSFNPNHPGDNNIGALSKGASHPVHHIQGAMGNTPAHPLRTQIPQASDAGESTGVFGIERDWILHARAAFNPTHTCATCKEIAANNFALEQHASKKRHQAFLCTCGTKFGRLGSLYRHVAAQKGPKYCCEYCDDSKGFARLDKLVDHLQGSHKFGKNAIAQFRSKARAESKGTGPTSSTIPVMEAGQPVSTSAVYDAGSVGVSVGQMANSAGTTAEPPRGFDGGMNDFPMFSTGELQPFAPIECYPWTGTAEDFDFSGIDFSGVDFADFDGNMVNMDF